MVQSLQQPLKIDRDFTPAHEYFNIPYSEVNMSRRAQLWESINLWILKFVNVLKYCCTRINFRPLGAAEIDLQKIWKKSGLIWRLKWNFSARWHFKIQNFVFFDPPYCLNTQCEVPSTLKLKRIHWYLHYKDKKIDMYCTYSESSIQQKPWFLNFGAMSVRVQY